MERTYTGVEMPKSVQLSDDAYATLRALRREGESFSDTVKRLASERKDPRALLELGPLRPGFMEFKRRMDMADRAKARRLFQRRAGGGRRRR